MWMYFISFDVKNTLWISLLGRENHYKKDESYHEKEYIALGLNSWRNIGEVVFFCIMCYNGRKLFNYNSKSCLFYFYFRC